MGKNIVDDRMYSFSSLEKYSTCSEKFRRHYLDKTLDRPSTDSLPTAAGTIVHTVLEDYVMKYKRERSVLDILHDHWKKTMAEEASLDLLPDLLRLETIMQGIVARGTAGYKGPDPILTGDGNFAKNLPGLKKTKGWDAALKASGLNEIKGQIDELARYLAEVDIETQQAAGKLQTKKRPWLRVSLCDVYLETRNLLSNYVDTLRGHYIHRMEFPLSDRNRETGQITNPVRFPFRDRPHFVGKIDIISTDAAGKLYIIDRKTSKTEPTPLKVGFWEQLVLYGWGHYVLTEESTGKGIYPDYIGIDSIRHGSLVVAPFDPAMIPGALRRAEQRIAAIEAGIFVEQNPVDFHQNCYTTYGQGNNETAYPCEFLARCHPRFAAAMGVR